MTIKFKAILLSVIGMMLSANAHSTVNDKDSDSIESTTVSPLKQTRSASQYSDTTYIRCGYRVNQLATDSSEVKSAWVWAKSSSNPKAYAVVHGYWKDHSPIKNMFYTDVSWQKIQSLCRSTLQASNLNSDIIIPYAGNSLAANYYTLWSQGADLPSTKDMGMDLDRTVIFGDSLSDTMNLYNATEGLAPNYHSWFWGHFSNGPVWHEYLSEDTMKIPSYVWATANSESGKKNVFPSFKAQLDNFKSYLDHTKGYDIGKTLFTVLFGGNDFITGNKTADQIINNYQQGLAELAEMGAKQVAVFRLPDFSVVPSVQHQSPAQQQKLQWTIVAFNDQLSSLLATLRTQYPGTLWISPALDTVFESVLKDPKKYGFVDTHNPCLNVSEDSGNVSYLKKYSPSASCTQNNANFVFWDEMHPTTKMHHVAADMLFTDMQNQFKQQLAIRSH